MDFEHLVRCNVSQNLNNAAGPTNLDSLDLFDRAGSEMHGSRTGGRVADGRRDLIALVAQPNHRAYSIAVTSCAGELEDQPVVHIRADVLPKFRRLAERAHYDVDFSVVVKIRKRTATMGSREA